MATKLARKATLLTKLTLGLSLVLSPAVAFAIDWHPYYAQYDALRGSSKLGSAQQILEYAGDDHYRLTYQSKASFLFLSDKRKEHSYFVMRDGHIQPIEYEYKRTGTGSDKQFSARFLPDQKQIIGSKKTLPWQGELDNQLYQLALREALQQGKTEFQYPVINNNGDLRTLKFEVVKQETLQLPFGVTQTVKVKRVREESSSRETFIWFAPQLDYLMVRLQQFKDGDEQANIVLREYKPGALKSDSSS